jgi:methylated-DNA-[protein]-cysteine S-methyltransferase
MFFAFLNDTPVGRLMVAGDESGLKHVSFQKTYYSSSEVRPAEDWEPGERKLGEALRQLKAYFKGRLRDFDLPLNAEGTEFQKLVWNELCRIPFGQTASYGDVAQAIGKPAASRAVGLANGRNPIAIIVPCHRVIGSNGKLVGYGGGLDQKQTLLELERPLVAA